MWAVHKDELRYPETYPALSSLTPVGIDWVGATKALQASKAAAKNSLTNMVAVLGDVGE